MTETSQKRDHATEGHKVAKPEPCFCGHLDYIAPDERTKICEEARLWLAQILGSQTNDGWQGV